MSQGAPRMGQDAPRMGQDGSKEVNIFDFALRATWVALYLWSLCISKAPWAILGCPGDKVHFSDGWSTNDQLHFPHRLAHPLPSRALSWSKLSDHSLWLLNHLPQHIYTNHSHKMNWCLIFKMAVTGFHQLNTTLGIWPCTLTHFGMNVSQVNLVVKIL